MTKKISPENEPFKFEQLFGSKTRSRLLGVFLLNPDDRFFVRELTRKIDAQLNSVRRELKNLTEIGLVNEIDEDDHTENKKYYTVNKHSILYDNLRALFQKVHILLKQNLVQEISGKGSVSYLAFTGRFVSNSNNVTDMIVIGDIKETALQTLVAEFEKEFGHEVNYTLMTPPEFQYRKDVKDRFLESVLEGEQIIIVNELGI